MFVAGHIEFLNHYRWRFMGFLWPRNRLSASVVRLPPGSKPQAQDEVA